MVYRAFHICSNYMNFHKEIEFLKDIFFKKRQNTAFFAKHWVKNAEKIHKPYGSYEVLNFHVPKCRILFPTYYLGITSKEFCKKFRSPILRYYPHVEIRTVFRKVESLGTVFRYKDALPEVRSSCLIYKYTCDGCNAFYIGKTWRTFWMRICEHKGISFRTGKELSVKVFSEIRNHHQEEHKNEVNIENFEILDKVSSKCSLNIWWYYIKNALSPALALKSNQLLQFYFKIFVFIFILFYLMTRFYVGV